MKKANKIQIEIILNGQGLVNYNGSQVPFRFKDDMKNNGKVSNNGSFAKENIYKTIVLDKDGNEKTSYVYKKIISSNLLRKCILGDENDVNADKLASNDALRVAYLSQDNVIARGYCVLGKSNVDIKRKSGVSVLDAEQISNTVTWLETRTAEGKRDDTSLFFKETCGEIKYKSNIYIDIKQLQFVSVDDNYDRISLADGDVEPFVKQINKRYGENNAHGGNWATTKTNVIGEQGVVLSNKVVNNIIREIVKKTLDINIKRSGSFAKTESVKIAIGYPGDSINLLSKPNFVEINAIEDYDKLVEDIEFGVDFLPIEVPVIEKIEKKSKKEVVND